MTMQGSPAFKFFVVPSLIAGHGPSSLIFRTPSLHSEDQPAAVAVTVRPSLKRTFTSIDPIPFTTARPFPTTMWPSAETMTPDSEGKIAADMDVDSDVDQLDYGLFQVNFGIKP